MSTPKTSPQMNRADTYLLTIPQVAAKLGVSIGKVHLLFDSGAFPRIRLSSRRCTRIHPDDLNAYIESLRPKPRRG